MRFLCLHGKGTNSQVLEMQLGAVRYQLGDGHSYEFVEGTIAEQAAPGIQALLSSKDQYLAYFDETSPSSCLKALNDLDRYINLQGPFHGVLSFSQGAALASTLLVRYARQTQLSAPFKVAIFFSGGVAADPDLLTRGVIRPVDHEEVGEVIKIPTVHIWGSVGRGELDWPPKLRGLCAKETREELQHDGGHEIPGSKDRAAVTGVVHLIRRAIWRATNAGQI